MFFILILRSLILQSASKPFSEQKNVIIFYLKKTPVKNVDLVYIDNSLKKISGIKKKYIPEKKLKQYYPPPHKKNVIITTINADELKSRIFHLNQKSQIKILKYNTLVHAAVEGYLRMGKYIGRIILLSYTYFPMFEEKFEKYHLPKELKYLAIVESNLNSTVTSQAGAKGIWQIMPRTGKKYNLKIHHNGYDERNDPVKSTEAACKYLKYLYKKIGNWELVLASYNAGPGRIDKLIRYKKKRKDFWNLWETLPKETQNYIPKFIAINYIMNYYIEHNIHTSNKYKKTRSIDSNKSLKKEKIPFKLLFSTSTSLNTTDFKFLNSQYLFFMDYITLPEKVSFSRFSISRAPILFTKKREKK
ncbi:lytic transglycosylase domain-containing protein [Blattabacterium cuenoti]|uniref:lytic transglycosylase domain-containing protein n=1 Tax=Blattabacterium cuenoti TaxID=1653831 RepID=UPI001EECD499|nr:lytic transglycosylase domain-containing protein [Blattabacterium cuenoti]